ncbi:hypothetical protein F4813DRAFT_401524 [Daldinia decipiens]|uniref:uncharacterized protein n=1 Tax=Daldinia decipiens TaxID=326647 RepID=UPI0020C2266D|nr:uncharacterized protein F4813DRAFT_401524 [Daldinia decipiens]KAI1659446.1 hypothetical protein F4813DRAFT_401524 [Daldinia decipiens]
MEDQDRSEIIRNNPIGNSLEDFFTLFSSCCESRNICSSGEALGQFSDKDVKDLIAKLLQGLQKVDVAQLLPSRTRGPLQADLLRLQLSLVSGDLDFDRVKPLLRAVINKKSDEDIWAQVYYTFTESTLPPRTIASHFQQTASSPNMVSLVNSSELRKNIDNILKEELGLMCVNVPRFYETFFGNILNLEIASGAIFERCCKEPDLFFREGWTGWPRDAEESAVLSWLQKIIKQIALWAQDYKRTPTRGLLAEPNKPLGGSTAKRKLDVGIVSCPEASADWSRILIPGELKKNPKEDRKDGAWLDIGRYVREVFAMQDTRRFVLAFTLCGSFMRVWEFDRLGCIASTQFDINKNGLQFVSTILGFLWLEDKDIGFDPTFVRFNSKRYIEINRDGTLERIVIDEVIGRVPCVVGRATTCWKAHPERDPSTTLVIKDSWQYPERDVEGDLLCMVSKKNVCNVARYYYHETVLVDGSVDDVQHGVRKGIDITEASNYQPHDLDTRRISQISQGSIAGQKRSSSQTSECLPSNKRSRSESSIKANRNTLPNRIHRRVIVRDYGQPIYKASSRVALLAALEGCIKGHESLRNAGILHRDISINNLMINEDNNDSNPWSSFLIDLDLAIREERESASGAKEKTGTRAFMAINVLLGEQHSFMHDLESFFWVLFWICIHYDGPGKSKVVPDLNEWNYMSMDGLAKLKMGTVTRGGIFNRTIKKYFTPYYMPLGPYVNKLREAVFDNGQGEDETLYSRMRDVLCKAQQDPALIYYVLWYGIT